MKENKPRIKFNETLVRKLFPTRQNNGAAIIRMKVEEYNGKIDRLSLIHI